MKPGSGIAAGAIIAIAVLALLPGGCLPTVADHDAKSGAADMLRGEDGETELKAKLRLFLSAVDNPFIVRDYIASAERRGIPRQQIVQALAQLVSEGLQAPRNDRLALNLCQNSLSNLGYLGHPSAVPVLVQASRSRDDNIRSNAIMAYVQVRGADSVGFAREVIDNKRDFNDLDRLVLYEQLSRCTASEAGLDPDAFQLYIMVEKPVSFGEPTRDPLEEKGAPVAELLAEAIQKERYPDCAKDLDRMLCAVSGLYKTSIQRERVLRRFARSRAREARTYFSAELTKFLQIPKEKRTDLGSLPRQIQ